MLHLKTTTYVVFYFFYFKFVTRVTKKSPIKSLPYTTTTTICNKITINI